MKRFAFVASLLLTPLCCPDAAQAMSFSDYEAMTPQDQGAFYNFLWQGAEQIFLMQHRYDEAAKVRRLFTEYRNSGDILTVGRFEFETNLRAARSQYARNPSADPGVPRPQVEMIMAETLKNHTIDVSGDFVKEFTEIAGTFQLPSAPGANRN